MNRKTVVIVVVALILGAVGIGWLYYQANPSAWDDFLAEMEGETTGRPAPRPVNRQASRSGMLTASGSIEAEEVVVAAELGGRISQIAAREGDEIAAETLLLQLDDSALLVQREGAEAAVAQAQAALDTAIAQVRLARAGATDEEISAMQASIVAAHGAVTAAEAALRQAEINAESARTVNQTDSSIAVAEAALAQAEGMVAAAEADLARAKAERSRVLLGGRSEEIAMYQALLNQAHSQYLYVEDIHRELIENKIGGRPEERARFQSESALGARDAAQAQLDLVTAGATTQEIAAASAVVAAAEAQVDIAEAGVLAAEAALAQAQAAPETTQDQVAMAEAGVAAAQAQVEIAEGQLAQVESELDRLEAGVTDEEIGILNAQVAQAEAALSVAEAALKAIDLEIGHTTLLAPAGGVILQRLVHEGELAFPGAPLFTLADLDEVTLTVYVPESELGQVSLDQTVEVTVDAYEDTFTGEVTHIASQAEFTPKNVQTQEERVHMVFAVKIRIANDEHYLKPGMPADALFR